MPDPGVSDVLTAISYLYVPLKGRSTLHFSGQWIIPSQSKTQYLDCNETVM